MSECGCTDFQCCPAHERQTVSLPYKHGEPLVIEGAISRVPADMRCERCGAELIDYGIDICCSDKACAEVPMRQVVRAVNQAFDKRRRARAAAVAEQIMQWVIDIRDGKRNLARTAYDTEELIYAMLQGRDVS